MNDQAALRRPAVLLAEWTRLPVEAFGDIYVNCAPSSAKDWKQLEADVGRRGGEALIAAAADEAERCAFISELALAVTKAERRRNRAEEEIAAIIAEVGLPGTMQALSDRAAGLMDPAILEYLAAARDACAYVSDQQGIKGTAFLVAPDLVLTSAHVVLRVGRAQNGSIVFEDKLKPQLQFSFPPDKRDTTRQWITVAASGDSPIAYAPPHGYPPDKLDRRLGRDSATRLDFALVRLSRQITHVTPLDITQPKEAEEHRRCFVFGYAGGTAIKFDADLITGVNLAGARLLHLANTVPGMSGSCCIGADGTPVGLHEGGFFKLDRNGRNILDANGLPVVESNRAVCLTKIREFLSGRRPDPLGAPPRSPGFGMIDRSLAVAWYGAGLRLAGEGLATAWTRSVEAVVGAIPDGGSDTLAFHPWFKRKDLEDWIDAAAAKPGDRLAYINGGRGTGKSFTVQLLSAKLPEQVRDLIVLTPTQTTAWSWQEAVARLRPPQTDGGELRTDAGNVKYVDVAGLIASLESYGGITRSSSGAPPLFMAIDFEHGAELSFEGTPWREFLTQLAAQSWVRLLVIGLADKERDTLNRILQAQRATETLDPLEIELAHADAKDLREFVRSVYLDRGQSPPTREINQLLEPWSDPSALWHTRAELQTCEAVLFAMAIYKAVAQLANAAVAPGAAA